MQPIPSIKSRPVYQPIEIDYNVKHHFFIAEKGAETELKKLYESCDTGNKSFWVIGGDQEGDEDGMDIISYEDGVPSLGKAFSKLPVSSSIYVAAIAESFIWDINNQAIEAGLAPEQVKKLKPFGHGRRLFCTHCYTITEDVTESPFECPGCHRLLLVRDHFSRLHSAYVGVQINAEDPSDVPEKEELS